MKRRDFIGLLGGAVALPFAAYAQRDQGVRRIGVLQPFAIDSAEKARIDAFALELQRLGRTDGGNLQIKYSWGPAIYQRPQWSWWHGLPRSSLSAPPRL